MCLLQRGLRGLLLGQQQLRVAGGAQAVALLHGVGGSVRGVRGFVTDALAGLDFTDFCACGPEPMFRALLRATDKPGQLSLEARMGCGFGACMGCSCKTKYGSRRICRDGPVLTKEEVVW